MATNNLSQISTAVSSCSSSSSTDASSKEICWLFRLPTEIFQILTDFLNTKDVQSLSQTCQYLYTFFNDNNFWIHRIHCQFPPAIVQLYTLDLFETPDIIPAYNEIRSPDFANVRMANELDILAITSATHYNDQAIEKRQAKMYVSHEEFFRDLEFYQFTKPIDCLNIPLMKLIYFYLSDRKRCAVVDMNVGHRNDHYLVEESDEDSLTGRIIHLVEVCWLEIDGRFEHKIMPGKYEVRWRMKGVSNGTNIWGETEFILVPQHGKLLKYTMTKDDFQNLILEHEYRWFVVSIGQTIIYEPSVVLMAIRNWNNGNWKRGLFWDCIEMTLVP